LKPLTSFDWAVNLQASRQNNPRNHHGNRNQPGAFISGGGSGGLLYPGRNGAGNYDENDNETLNDRIFAQLRATLLFFFKYLSTSRITFSVFSD
jgi:hypothetical protein